MGNIWEQGNYRISMDPEELDIELVHHYLSKESYWAKDRSLQKVQRAVKNSFVFGLYHQEQQIGFARVVSDCAIFAYVMDVFILEAFRGRGLGKQLIQAVLQHSALHEVEKWMLATEDAHEFYQSHGFQAVELPQGLMEKAG